MPEKTFGTKIEASGGVNENKSKPVKELTTEEKVDNIAQNMSNALNTHANALNALALWVETNDKKVMKAGGLMQWAIKETQKKERLAQRKAEYKASKE